MKNIQIKFIAMYILGACNFYTCPFDGQVLIDHVKKSIHNAALANSKINNDVLDIEGYTSPKIKHFLNNICSLIGASYLEIGVFRGSTFISALYNNTENLKQATAIDNWSEFGGPRQSFFNNVQKFLPQNSFIFYDVDCFQFNIQQAFQNPVDIYFYDGNHASRSQELAFTFYNNILANTFIAIIDDWAWATVQEGTRSAFKKLNYNILYEQELLSRPEGSDKELWWNGLYVAVISKH